MTKIELAGLLAVIISIILVSFDLPFIAAPIALIAVGCFVKGQSNDKGRNPRRNV